MRASAMPMSLQRLLDRVGVEFLVADERDRADRRPLLHGDDQHVALRLEAHVAEEACRVQRLDRLRRLLVVDALADLDRQVAEDRAGLGALHALDADVLHDERIERPATRDGRQRDAHSAATSAGTARRRSVGSACAVQSRGRAGQNSRENVIEERQGHQHGEHGHADALADLEGAVRDAGCP